MFKSEEINEMFDRFFTGEPAPWPAMEFAPEVDVSETDKEIRVSAEVPGVDEKDIDISLADDGLVIKGEKKAEKEEKEGQRHYIERTYGSFERRIALPCEVDADKVSATYKKGVLTITLPKTAKAKESVKKITVSAGS